MAAHLEPQVARDPQTANFTEFKDYVPHDQIVVELAPVFARFAAERIGDETFGDFCDRVGVAELAGTPASV